MNEGTRFGTSLHSRKVVQEPHAYEVDRGWLFKSGFEKPVHGVTRWWSNLEPGATT